MRELMLLTSSGKDEEADTQLHGAVHSYSTTDVL